MGNFVVTIGREFGSGGREIGEAIAEKLNFTFYSEKLVSKASEVTGIDESFFRKVDERQKKSFWYMFAMSNILSDGTEDSIATLPTNEKLFIEQTKVIEDLAEKENCVIVGRCSNYILKDLPNALHIFIYSNMNSKLRRTMERQNMTEHEAKKLIHKIEKERRTYYNYYTEYTWGDKQDYDICLDSSRLTEEEMVDIVYNLVRARMNKLNGKEKNTKTKTNTKKVTKKETNKKKK